MGVRLAFRLPGDIHTRRQTLMKTALSVAMALKYAIRKAVANHAKGKNFSRRSPLTMETLIRLLIGAEGGSLDKILYTAGIKVTASAVSQRRAPD